MDSPDWRAKAFRIFHFQTLQVIPSASLSFCVAASRSAKLALADHYQICSQQILHSLFCHHGKDESCQARGALEAADFTQLHSRIQPAQEC